MTYSVVDMVLGNVWPIKYENLVFATNVSHFLKNQLKTNQKNHKT